MQRVLSTQDWRIMVNRPVYFPGGDLELLVSVIDWSSTAVSEVRGVLVENHPDPVEIDTTGFAVIPDDLDDDDQNPTAHLSVNRMSDEDSAFFRWCEEYLEQQTLQLSPSQPWLPPLPPLAAAATAVVESHRCRSQWRLLVPSKRQPQHLRQ